jgi:hypothetical protein
MRWVENLFSLMERKEIHARFQWENQKERGTLKDPRS